MNVSHLTLKRLAALIWYIGPVILLTKGTDLANQAFEIDPQGWSRLISWSAGITIGIIKTRYIFIKSCRKNMARIDDLSTPKVWQFYRTQFFFFLGLMMIFGATLSRVSAGNYGFLIAVATLDISIGTALFLSSKVFWEQNVFSFRSVA